MFSLKPLVSNDPVFQLVNHSSASSNLPLVLSNVFLFVTEFFISDWSFFNFLPLSKFSMRSSTLFSSTVSIVMTICILHQAYCFSSPTVICVVVFLSFGTSSSVSSFFLTLCFIFMYEVDRLHPRVLKVVALFMCHGALSHNRH